MNKKIKILVTGANGQLGSEFKEIAKNNINEFVFTDVDEIDIIDYNLLEKSILLIKPDIIINCAAYTNVDKAEDEMYLAYLINADAINNIAKLSFENNIKLIHISTDYVYDGISCNPYKETDLTNPISIYGKTKLKGEREMILSCCNGIIIRTSWLYSKFGNNFMKTILNHANKKSTLNVVFDQIGTPTYAADLAKSIVDIIPSLKDIKDVEIFNYSNEGVCSWYDFATEIVQIANLNCKIIPILSEEYPTKAQRPFYSVLDKAKIKHAFNINIPHWRNSLQKCMSK